MNKRFIYLFCLVFVLFSCSQKEEHKYTTDDQVDMVDTNSVVVSRFIPAEQTDIDKISLGVKKGISLCDCYKTKSLDFENVFAIACKVKYDVKVEGAEIAVGTWAMGGNAGIFSVGPVTSLISDWGNNPKRIKIEDEGFREVSNYVRDLPSSCGN
jgi:hypothetical protein